MGYRLVADAAMVAHFSFLAYLVVGGFIAWKWPWTIWTHIAAALYGFFNVWIGWPCPLTHVENWGRARAGEAALPGTGFIDHYIAGVVYPQEHEASVRVLVAAAVLTSWIGFVIRRRRRVRRRSGRSGCRHPRPDPGDRAGIPQALALPRSGVRAVLRPACCGAGGGATRDVRGFDDRGSEECTGRADPRRAGR